MLLYDGSTLSQALDLAYWDVYIFLNIRPRATDLKSSGVRASSLASRLDRKLHLQELALEERELAFL